MSERAAAGRGRWSRAAIAATFFAHGLYFASWTAHIPHVKAALGLSTAGLGVVLLAAPLGVVCALAGCAGLLPRWGSRRAVRWSIAGYCLCGPLVGLAPSPVLLFLALLAWGACQATLDMAMNTQGITVERLQGRRLMSTLHGCWSLGAFTGAALGTVAVGAGVSLTAQMSALVVPIVLVVGGLSRAMVDDDAIGAGAAPGETGAAPGETGAAPGETGAAPGEAGAAPGEAGAAPAAGRGRHLLLSRPVLTLAAIAFAGLVCEGAAADWSAVFLRGPLHTSAGFAGLGYTIFSLAMVTVRMTGDRLLSRRRAHRVIPTLATVATVGFACGLAVAEPVVALVGFACLGLGLGTIVPTTFSAAGRLPGVPVGAAVSTVAALSYSGFVCGPPLIGALSGLLSLRAGLAVLPVLTGIVALLAARTRVLD